MNSPAVVISKRTVIKCCCGKICKGNRGLKMHQRSCRVIQGLNNELCADLEEQITDNNTDTAVDEELNTISNRVNIEEIPVLKKGINLPKRDSEWSTANEYFKSALLLNGPIMPQELNTSIQVLNDTIYTYFADNFGNTETIPDESLINKYKDHTVKKLKKALANLKSSNSDPTEIKYVSRTLRDKLRNNNNNTQTESSHEYAFNHDKYLQRNFWGYVKNVLGRKQTLFPSFTVLECFNYFKKSLAAIHPEKLFPIPNWIPKLCRPQIQFDLDPPTYQQITTVIRKMKTSGSPCLLDQLSTRRLLRRSLRLPTRSKSTQTRHLYTTAQAETDPRHFRM